jgi:hypothetical protein
MSYYPTTYTVEELAALFPPQPWPITAFPIGWLMPCEDCGAEAYLDAPRWRGRGRPVPRPGYDPDTRPDFGIVIRHHPSCLIGGLTRIDLYAPDNWSYAEPPPIRPTWRHLPAELPERNVEA